MVYRPVFTWRDFESVTYSTIENKGVFSVQNVKGVTDIDAAMTANAKTAALIAENERLKAEHDVCLKNERIYLDIKTIRLTEQNRLMREALEHYSNLSITMYAGSLDHLKKIDDFVKIDCFEEAREALAKCKELE